MLSMFQKRADRIFIVFVVDVMRLLYFIDRNERFLGPMREILLLSAAAVGAPLLVQYFLFDFKFFDDATLYVTINFAVCLLVYHIILGFRSNSKMILKLIDYVYLSVTFFAIWIGAADVTTTRYTEEQARLVSGLHTYLKKIDFYVGVNNQIACSEATYKRAVDYRARNSTCGAYRYFIKSAKAKAAIFEGDMAAFIDNVPIVITMLEQDEKLYNPIVYEMNEEAMPNLEFFRHWYERIRDKPIVYSRLSQKQIFSSWREMGFVLAASALALRITRVTIELARWHK